MLREMSAASTRRRSTRSAARANVPAVTTVNAAITNVRSTRIVLGLTLVGSNVMSAWPIFYPPVLGQNSIWRSGTATAPCRLAHLCGSTLVGMMQATDLREGNNVIAVVAQNSIWRN